MDLVYQSARKVVIALEDIALTTTDADLMFMCANNEAPISQTSEDDHQALASAFGKIVSARWFAIGPGVCMKFLVSRRHVFLVPIC